MRARPKKEDRGDRCASATSTQKVIPSAARKSSPPDAEPSCTEKHPDAIRSASADSPEKSHRSTFRAESFSPPGDSFWSVLSGRLPRVCILARLMVLHAVLMWRDQPGHDRYRQVVKCCAKHAGEQNTAV